MSRLREKLPGPLLEAGMLSLVAWALLKPMLQIYMMPREGTWVLALAGALSLVLAALRRLPRRPRVAAWLAALTAFTLWALTGPLVPALGALARALLAGGTAANSVVMLYADALVPLAVLGTVLYARLLVGGEPGFSAPLLLSSVLMMWFSGARGGIADFVPAVAAVPLLFAYAGHPGEALSAPPARRAAGGLLRALPVALAIILLAVGLTPPNRVTNPEMERQADRLRQMLNDYFFFTDARQSFSISALGYQPMAADGLGGEPQVSNAMVLEVDTTHKVYLRGTVLDLYNGRMWYDTISRERYGYAAMRWQQMRDTLLDSALPAPDMRLQSRETAVRVLSKMPSTVFVPQRLRALSMGEGMVPYLNASSELFITRGLQEGDQYSADYEQYVAGQPETDRLAQRLRGAPDARVDTLPGMYRQVPAHLQPTGVVAGLTRQVVGDEQDPYLKAMRIRAHLRDTYAYSLQVPDAPQDMDFVAHFLFDVKQGYCTYFASAMVVMSRMAGLNARYVEGFAVSPPEGGGPAIVTGQQAHAWAEVYIPAMGWVTFDATGTTGSLPPPPEQPPEEQQDPEPAPEEPQEQPTPEPEQQEPEPSDEPQPSQPPETPEEEEQPEPDGRQPRRSLWWLWLLLAAVAAFLIWRARQTDPHRLALKADARGGVLLYWQALLAARQQAGSPILTGETPREYARRTAPDDRGLQSLADTVSALVYGRHWAEAERVTAARLHYQSAVGALNPWQRARLVLSRLGADLRSGWRLAWGRGLRALRGLFSRQGRKRRRG